MSHLIKFSLKSRALNLHRGFLSSHTSRLVHISSTFSARSEYDKIKLKPFLEAPYDGSTKKWRRYKRYPHHVENIQWRERQGLPFYLNSSGPLTDNPDYSYVDETLKRPSTYNSSQKRRLMEQKEHAETIIALCKQVDYGKEAYQKLCKDQEKARQIIINSKLKPKGNEIL